MRTFQVRLADEVHSTIKEIARRQRISIADVIREALEIYAIGIVYAEQGKRLVWEDPTRRMKAKVLIPGFIPAPERSFIAKHAERGKKITQRDTTTRA